MLRVLSVMAVKHRAVSPHPTASAKMVGCCMGGLESLMTCVGVIVVFESTCYNRKYGKENRKRSINTESSPSTLYGFRGRMANHRLSPPSPWRRLAWPHNV